MQIENEARAALPQKGGASQEQLSTVEETILRISGQVSVLTRQQKYFRTRENRNFSTVNSTARRIFNLSLMECGAMVAMAGLQVFIVRWFFTGGRKGLLLQNLCSTIHVLMPPMFRLRVKDFTFFMVPLEFI